MRLYKGHMQVEGCRSPYSLLDRKVGNVRRDQQGLDRSGGRRLLQAVRAAERARGAGRADKGLSDCSPSGLTHSSVIGTTREVSHAS